MKIKNEFNHGFVVFLFTLFLGFFPLLFLSAQGWYDIDWQYRRNVNVNNSGSTNLTDFQVFITLDGSFDFSKVQSNGNDIRFTSDDGVTLIPFWIETWDPGNSNAGIWVNVPNLPASGSVIFLYYGNSNPIIPDPDPVETPPVGPFTRDPINPINPAGDPGGGANLLAENIVYDDVSGHYWMVFANYRSGDKGVGLVWSDTPSDASSWNWYGNIYTQTSGGSFAPNIIKQGGLWYVFFAKWPDIVYITCSTINGTYSAPTTVLSPSETWEAYRVDEPYVFQRNDGKWTLIYMGDAGSITEQVGYATSDNITGPYTKYAGNPCLAFGPSGSYDAGTVADPWVYEYYGVYYIGYTVSPSKNSPWQTALATTSDWQTFTKHGVIFPVSSSGWDSNNSFRGAVTRIGDTYVFSYTGDSYKMGIATQPVYMVPADVNNDPDAVFDFYDDFEGTDLDLSKWSFSSGTASQTDLTNGLLTLTASNTFLKIVGQTSFGMDYIGETRAYHPDQGTQDLIAEVGFADNNWNTVRIVDDFTLGTTYWQRQAKLSGQPDDWVNMSQTADDNWHLFSIYRQSPDMAGFQIDDNPVETVTTNVPATGIPPFLMSYGNGNVFVVDWTRVRKWAGGDATTTVGTELPLDREDLWIGAENNDWHNPNNWASGYTPTSTVNVTIPVGPANYPTITAAGSCNNLTLKSDASGTASLLGNSYLTISGNTVVERYLTQDMWHYISAPVDDPNADVFLGMYMMEWDEPTGEWTFIVDPGYTLHTDMEGFAVWADNSEIAEFTGLLNSGPKSINTTYTAGAPHNNKGFNFAGNPYPSSLDWNVNDGSGWTRSAGNIDLALYIWNSTVGNYGVYVKDAASGTNDVNNLIPPHQGFFVSCYSATGYIGVDEGARVHGNIDILKTGNNCEALLKLKVSGNDFSDETMFRIMEESTIFFDNNFDARKYKGDDLAPQLYSFSEDVEKLSVNTFPFSPNYADILIGFDAGAEGTYMISVSSFSGFDSGEVYLEDIYEGNVIQLDENSIYSFNAQPSANPARFMLHLNILGADENYLTDPLFIYTRDHKLFVSSSLTIGRISVFNMLGQEIAFDDIHEQLTSITVEESGAYIIRILQNAQLFVKKVIVR